MSNVPGKVGTDFKDRLAVGKIYLGNFERGHRESTDLVFCRQISVLLPPAGSMVSTLKLILIWS